MDVMGCAEWINPDTNPPTDDKPHPSHVAWEGIRLNPRS